LAKVGLVSVTPGKKNRVAVYELHLDRLVDASPDDMTAEVRQDDMVLAVPRGDVSSEVPEGAVPVTFYMIPQ